MAQGTAKLRKRRAREAEAREARAANGAAAAQVSVAKSRFQFTGWQWACLGLLAGAAILRLFELAAKVLHHDEGVNGLFMTNLFRNGYYHYDPSNYHGPTLYYAGLVTTTVNAIFYGKYGLSTFAVRLVTAVFGIALVWLFLCLRRQLGTFGAFSAGVLAAVSSGLVFFSRYFIHEILFVFFTLGVVVAVLWYQETRQPKYLFLAAASLAMLGATKETWIITVAVWLLALLCTQAWMYLRRRGREEPAAKRARPAPAPNTSPASLPAEEPWSQAQLYITAAAVFVAVWVLFYSSFFTNFPQGVYDSVRTFTYWFKTGRTDDLADYWTYLKWLVWRMPAGDFRPGAELAAMALGFLGTITALAKAQSRFAVFTAFWSLGMLAAYSLVPYKTPWLALSIVTPFIVMAGYFLQQMYEDWRLKAFAVVLLAAAAVGSLYQAIDTSFWSYDDENQTYSYAHSKRDLLNLVDEVERIAAGNAAGKNIGITVMANEHWPLPWYFREYPHAGFYGKVVPTSEPMAIVHESQMSDAVRTLGDNYRLFSVHVLRPGNRLYLFLRKDVQP
ncbi:MAG TPA: flippase activity-associated protein Agl23 [Candidatus Angelobacter sp.]